jgi:predicted ATPase
MPAPEFLVHAAQGWARLYADTRAVSTGVMYVHFAGLLLGGGAAVAADRETLKAAREPEPVRADHLAFLATVHGIAITGLAMLAASGVAMFLADLDTFWGAKAFWIKMSLIALLLANGLVMRQAEQLARTLPARAWRQLKTTSILSLVLWFAILLAGTMLASS